VRQRFGAPFWITAGEYGFARMMSAPCRASTAPPRSPTSSATAWWPRTARADANARNYYPTLVPAVPEAYTRLQDGQQVGIGGRAGA
jgi:uncharacterized MAPEG superfamily protein